MSAYDLMLSESQERMLIVCKPGSWEGLKVIFDKWNLSSAIIGEVTDTGRVEAIYKGRLEVDMPVAPLTDSAPKYQRPMSPSPPYVSKQEDKGGSAEGDATHYYKILKAKPLPHEVFEQYDRHVGTRTCFDSKSGGAALLHIKGESEKLPYLGVSISSGSDELFGPLNPKACGAQSVLSCARPLFALGTTPLAVTDCLNFGSPENPEIMRQFSDAIDGIAEACAALSIPVVSGNVSLYNDTDGEGIFPTPMIGMVGKIDDIRLALSPQQSQPSHLYLLTGENSLPFKSSFDTEFYGVASSGLPPEPTWEDERRLGQVLQKITSLQSGRALACRDLGFGGVLNAALKMVIESGLAFIGHLESFDWTARRHASYLLSFPEETRSAVEALLRMENIKFLSLGFFTKDSHHRFSEISLDVEKARDCLRGQKIFAP